MQTTTSIEQIRSTILQAKANGSSISLVPTMGALHAGHRSLIRAARKETTIVAVTIFVNPTQFGPNEDLDRYPRPLESDLEICRAEKVDLVFTPRTAEMYGEGFCTYVEVHGMQNVLCGQSRPTHFRGVTTVVLKLFNLFQPDYAYFGQKDAQQARIIQKMIDDLNLPVTMRICPIIREPDGLALSSRNQYLDRNQRSQATVLHQALRDAKQRIAAGERDSEVIVHLIRNRLYSASSARIDYTEVVSFETLQSVEKLSGRILIALAVYFGDTRLIDNMLIDT